MIEHNYKTIDGWFIMEDQYLYLLNKIPNDGIFVELGAWKGKSTSFIVTEIINRNMPVKFFTVDTFEGVINGTDKAENEAYVKYNLSEIYDTFLNNTNHLKEHFTTIKSKSDVAAHIFKDESIDCIFIDAGHSYESVLNDLKCWFPKMKKNSIMSGHDYNSYGGVKKVVDEFFGTIDKVENDCWFKNLGKI